MLGQSKLPTLLVQHFNTPGKRSKSIYCTSLPVIAQRGYFKDQAFINYLKYLLYWKEPEYARFIKYPTCLYFLDLLQYEHFRREIINAQCCKFIDDQSVLLWQHYTRRRIKLLSMHNNSSHLLNNSSGGLSTPAGNQNSTANNNGGTLMQNGVGQK